jgi:hypothetical protein
MYQTHTETMPRALRVFSDVSSAMKWLEVPSDSWEEGEPGGEEGSAAPNGKESAG